jgi:peptidoglycan biosynthesis protein MviN/MurJ (putative lipid II flippase)
VAGTLAAVAVGVVGQTAFYISMQGAYARQDTRTPLVSMSIQAAVCLSLALATFAVPGEQGVRLLGAAYATGALVGGAHLTRAVARRSGLPARRLAPLLRRLSVGALAMTLPVLAVAKLSVAGVEGRAGWILALLLGSAVGAAVYLGAQRAMHSPELASLRRSLRGRAPRHAMPEEVVP